MDIQDSPLRFIKRNLNLTQECYVILLCKRLGSEVQKFGLAREHIATHLIDGGLVER